MGYPGGAGATSFATAGLAYPLPLPAGRRRSPASTEGEAMSEISGAKCDWCGQIALGAEGMRSMVSFSGSGYLFFPQGEGPQLTYDLIYKHWCPWCLVADVTRWVQSFAPGPPPARLCDYGGCGQSAAYESTKYASPDSRLGTVPVLYACKLHTDAWAQRSWTPLRKEQP